MTKASAMQPPSVEHDRLQAHDLSEAHIANERTRHDAKYAAMVAIGERAVSAGDEYQPRDIRAALLYALTQLGDVRDQRVLELGSGLGWTAIVLAHRGAHVLATDVSSRSIEVIERRVVVSGVADRVQARVMAAEHLAQPDASVDHIFGQAVLHHLELAEALGECERVLRPGGRAVFLEPLSENPVLDFIRDYLPYREKKSPKGHRGIDRARVQRTDTSFATTHIRPFYLTSMVNRAFGYSVSITPLERLDDWLLHRMPPLGRLCRYCVVTYVTAG